MSDNVSVEAVAQAVNHGNGTAQGMPSPLASEAPAATSQDLAQWQQVMQAYYKQQQQPQGQQTAFYPAAAHPYAGFFAGQPLMYGPPFYGGIVPYAYPAPSAAGVPGSDTITKVDKPVATQPTLATSSAVSTAQASLPPRSGQFAQAQKTNMHSKASSSSLNGLGESGQYAKQSTPKCTPPASPMQSALPEHSKEKILHASDAEGIKAEGQAAAMAAIAAAQAHVNGSARDDSRNNSGEYWVRSNSEEDMERADSGGLQDEREVKRQRRKQSNRESARRSRLRKQAECEALAVRVNELMNENVKLRAANEQLLKLQHMTTQQASEAGKA